MNAPSGKGIALWIIATIGWLAFTALLETMGVSPCLLLWLHILAMGVVLWRIGRVTLVSESGAFLSPVRDGPTALTPYGAAAAWISGFGTVGVASVMLMQGPVAYMLIGGIVGGIVLVQTVIAPWLADSGARSLSDWVQWRFGERAGPIMTVLLVLTGIAILTLQFGFAALLAEAVLGVPGWQVVPLVAVLVLLALLPGGLETMLPAQAALYLVLFVGILVPALWLAMAQTGIVVPHLAPGALLHEIAVAEEMLALTRTMPPGQAMVLGLTVLLGTLALPHTLSRWTAERDGMQARWFAQRGTVLVFLILAAVPLFVIAVRAEQLFAALGEGMTVTSGETPRAALALAMATLDPPAWLIAAICAGALAAVVAASASAAFLVTTTLDGDPGRETAGGLLSRCRWAAAGAVGLAVLLALAVPINPVAGFIGLMTLAASAFLAPLVLGLLWFGMTTGGAVAGLLCGAMTCIILGAQGWGVMDGLALWGLAASTLASIIVSVIWSEPTLSPPLTLPPES